MKYNDEFNNLGITNADGDQRFNEDVFEMPSNDKNQPDIEVTSEGSEEFQVDEYLQEAGELDTTSEENFNTQDNPQEQVNSSSSTSSSTASTSASSTAAASTTAAASSAGIAATVATSVVVVATVTIGIVALPIIPTFDVELARATNSSLAFILSTNVEELDNVRVSLTGDDYEIETPYSAYIKFEELLPQETYYLSIYNEDTQVYNATYFTNNEDAWDTCFIEVYEQSEEGFYFTFFDGLVEDETARFHNIKVIANNGDVILADDTNDMEKEYFVNKNVDASILVYVNGVVEGGATVTKYSEEAPVIEYDYDNIQWTWAEYGESCSVYIPAIDPNNDPLIADASVEVTYRNEPQCEVDGYLTATATFVAPNGETYTDLYQCVLPATGHTYGEPEYTWDVDYYRCYAIRKCINNVEHYEEEFAYSEYEVVIEPTTETEGLGRYTAVFENEAFETQTVEVTLPVVEETNMETFSDFSNCVNQSSMMGTGSVTSNLGNTFEMNIFDTNANEYTGALELINVFGLDDQSIISNKTPTEKPIKGIVITTDAGENNRFEVGVGFSMSEIDSSSTAAQISGYKQVISSTSYTWYTAGEEIYYFSIILGANDSSGHISSITILYEDISYTIDDENNTIEYGVYPTTLVTDSSIIETLSVLGENYIEHSSGYYSYNGTFYDCVVIEQENSIELYDGTILESGQAYWFECTNIEWKILDVDDEGYYTLISTDILDTVQYHTTEAMDTISTDAGVTSVYANNYYNSYVRGYLLQTFGYKAFFNSNTTLINPVEFDVTEAATYGIKSDGINTTLNDMIHLPTYNELYKLYNSALGGSDGRAARLTTYAIAKGGEMTYTIREQGTQKALGSYWLSTPGTEQQYNAAHIDYNGELYNKVVTETNAGIRPIIRIKL